MRRRSFLTLPLAAVPASAAPLSAALQPKNSKQIAASTLSVGMETLDRSQFDPSRTYELAGRLGVKWARLQTGWARTERTAGEYDFRWLDQVVDSLLAAGVQPWFSLGYGNRLYTPEAAHESAVGYIPITPQAREAWARYVSRAAAHFSKRVKYWEVWNEPNGKGFWRPNAPDPAGYADLVKLTAPEIRKAIPDACVIGCGLAGLGNALPYLEAALDAGLGAHVQCISYHPYRQLPETNYVAEMRALRNLVGRHGKFKLWQGECGVSSKHEGILSDHWVHNEELQAKWILRRTLLDLQAEVDLTSYFHLVDLGNYIWETGPTGRTICMGLLNTEYQPKPAYYAYQRLCTLFDAETQAADLMILPAMYGVQTASFVRRGCAVFAYWQPAPILEPYTPRPVAARVSAGRSARFDNPVLIDMMTGEIRKPERASRKGTYWQFPALPLMDYPVLIAEAGSV
jgi:hypothetical protein